MGGASKSWDAYRPPIYTKGPVARLATTATRQAVGIYRSFLLRQRRCLPSALRGLNALKGFKDLRGLRGPSRPFCSFQNRRPRPSGTPSNLEGDVHGAVHTISTTPPNLPFRRGGVLKWCFQALVVTPSYSWVSFLIPVPKAHLNFQFSIQSQTPPPFGLLGGAAERNFDHPSQPPLS